MLSVLTIFRGDGSAAEAGNPRPARPAEDRRLDIRHDFTGRSVRLFVGIVPFGIHMKTLSCKGASGLTDAPVVKGQIVGLELDADQYATARICWIRRSLVGLAFFEPLDFSWLSALHARHQRGRSL